MMEDGVKDMINETLKGGGYITQAKGHDQELIMALMSSKDIFWNIILFHMYLINFGKELSTI
jgi:hypothetical protein